MQTPLPLTQEPINGQEIRKEWYKGEWYYSVIDIIAELLESDHKKAKSYWSTVKGRLIKNNVPLPEIRTVKMTSLDAKVYRTDCTNLEGIKWIHQQLELNLRNRVSRIKNRKDDEVINFHPKMIEYLQQNGFQTQHHFKLKSGNIIDIVAYSERELLVIECKPNLTKSKLYSAIGQVLCYKNEYDCRAIPAIACYKDIVDDYLNECCNSLGIKTLTI
jgi:hypothetical protein